MSMWNCEQVRNYYAGKVILSQLLILHRHSNDPGSTWLAAAHTYRPTTVTSESSKLPPTPKWKKNKEFSDNPGVSWNWTLILKNGTEFCGLSGGWDARSSRDEVIFTPPPPPNVKGKVLNFCSEICNVTVKLTITPTEVCWVQPYHKVHPHCQKKPKHGTKKPMLRETNASLW